MHSPSIIAKDPSELSIHPLTKLVPEWGKDDPRFIALVEDVRERGIDKLILIDRENRIVDGRSLWRAAKQLQIAEIECKVLDADEVAGAIVAGLLHRRNLTKGQRAYVVFPILEPAWRESRERHLENLKNPNKSQSSTEWTMVKTSEQFAAQIGISRPLLYQAAELHKQFANTKKFDWNDERKPLTLREYYEPRILDDESPMGLGGVIAGIGSKLSPSTVNQTKSEQLQLFSMAFDTLTKRFEYWVKFSAKQKLEATQRILEAVASMPEDLREALEDAIKSARKKEAA